MEGPALRHLRSLRSAHVINPAPTWHQSHHHTGEYSPCPSLCNRLGHQHIPGALGSRLFSAMATWLPLHRECISPPVQGGGVGGRRLTSGQSKRKPPRRFVGKRSSRGESEVEARAASTPRCIRGNRRGAPPAASPVPPTAEC